MPDLQFLDQPIEPALDFGLIKRGTRGILLKLEHRSDVFFNRQLAKHRRFLRQVGQAESGASMDRQPSDGPIVQRDAATITRHETDDHVKAGGFARAVWAQQSDDLPARDFDRYIANDAPPVIRLHQLGCDEPAAGRDEGHGRLSAKVAGCRVIRQVAALWGVNRGRRA